MNALISRLKSVYSYSLNNTLSNNNIIYADYNILINNNFKLVVSPLLLNNIKFNDLILINSSITNMSSSKIELVMAKLYTADGLTLAKGTLINSDNMKRYTAQNFNTEFAALEPLDPGKTLNIQMHLQVNPVLDDIYLKTPLKFCFLFKAYNNDEEYSSLDCIVNISQTNVIINTIIPFKLITFENTGTTQSAQSLYKCNIPSDIDISKISVSGTLNDTPQTILKRILARNLFLTIPKLNPSTSSTPNILKIFINVES